MPTMPLCMIVKNTISKLLHLNCSNFQTKKQNAFAIVWQKNKVLFPVDEIVFVQTILR